MMPISSITCDQPAWIEVEGKVFVTTGEFRHDRLAIEKSIKDMGGILKGHCSRYTHYLVVGERGPCSYWKFGNYGTKLDRAVRLRDAGYDVVIVMEGDFLRAATRRTVKQAVAHVDAISARNRPPALAANRSWLGLPSEAFAIRE